MDRGDVGELHYIAAVSNLASILEQGILGHARAERVDHVSVASVAVQARRATRTIPGGLELHRYANLYFNARNAMLYKLLNDYDAGRRVSAAALTILQISPLVLDLPDAVITDINAAADVEPRWHSVGEGLPTLQRSEIYAESWLHAEPAEQRRRMQRMMAEVLVPHLVPANHIVGAYVVDGAAAAAVTQAAPTLATQAKPYLFFQGG